MWTLYNRLEHRHHFEPHHRAECLYTPWEGVSVTILSSSRHIEDKCWTFSTDPFSAALTDGLDETGVIKRCWGKMSLIRKAKTSRRVLGGAEGSTRLLRLIQVILKFKHTHLSMQGWAGLYLSICLVTTEDYLPRPVYTLDSLTQIPEQMF